MSPPAPERKGSSFLALTIVGPASAADLSLAASVPLAELLPDLVDLVAAGCGAAAGAGWALSRLGGGPLDPDRSLAGAGVHEGDVLYLRPVEETRAAVVIDLPAAVADAVDVRGGLWSADARRLTAALAAAAALLLATGIAAVTLSEGPRLATALAVAVLAGVGARLTAGRVAAVGPVLLGLSGLAPGGLAGATAGALLDPGTPAWIAAGAAAGIGCGAAAAALAVPAARGPAAGAALAACPAGIVTALGAALGTSAGQAASVLAVWNVCLASQLPAVAAGLHLTGRVEEDAAGSGAGEVAQRVDAAHRLLAWLSAGTAAGLGGALAVLSVSARPWELALAGTAALAAALGSRRRRFLGQGLPPMIAAIGGGLLVEIGIAARAGGSAPAGIAVGLLLLSFALLLGLALASGGSAASALLRRRLRRLESLALVALVPLGLGALGAFTTVADLGRRLG